MSHSEQEVIEMKIAFLERANHELSDVVYRQQREIDELKMRLSMMVRRMEDMAHPQRPYSEEEERPPHY